MPSSISNSERRVPALKYGALWFSAVFLFLTALIGLETAFRHQGHRPVVVDSPTFWSLHRSDVYTENNRRRIVIAGASRAQLGLDPAVMERQLAGYRVKQLSINATPAFEVVRDLCEDPGFDGVLLWSATARLLFPPAGPGRKDAAYTRFYHTRFKKIRYWQRNADCWLRARLQSQFVTLAPHLSLRSLTASRFKPKANVINLRFDRHMPARYYEMMTDEERSIHRQKRIRAHGPDNTECSDIIEFEQFLQKKLVPLHRLLISRGGELILLRMPTTDEHWGIDNRRVPKHLFWDRIEKLTGIPTLHFRDYPVLASFDCPDTSHLDEVDAVKFTRYVAPLIGQLLQKKHPLGSHGQ